MLVAGSVVAGRYRVLELLGEGGMGQVWRGEDVRLERAVAVKVLLPHLLHGHVRAQALSRFEREGRAAARLSHRNIAVVHDVGEHDGQPYLVLEYLRGRDLKSLLREFPHGLPVEDALSYGAQTAEGLAAAHAAGIVHRDVKPANLVLGDDGTVKICDFGIARLHDATAGLTGDAKIGTLAYHGPRAAHGAGRRSPHRPLRARRDPVPDADRPPCLRRRGRPRCDRPAPERAAARGPRTATGHPAPGRRVPSGTAGQGAWPTASGRDGGGPASVESAALAC